MFRPVQGKLYTPSGYGVLCVSVYYYLVHHPGRRSRHRHIRMRTHHSIFFICKYIAYRTGGVVQCHGILRCVCVVLTRLTTVQCVYRRVAQARLTASKKSSDILTHQ